MCRNSTSVLDSAPTVRWHAGFSIQKLALSFERIPKAVFFLCSSGTPYSSQHQGLYASYQLIKGLSTIPSLFSFRELIRPDCIGIQAASHASLWRDVRLFVARVSFCLRFSQTHPTSSVIDFLTLAGPVTSIQKSPLTAKGRRLLLKAGAIESEADVVPYLPHTITVEPLGEFDWEYDHVECLPAGFYYVVSPKVELNKISKQINSPLTWTLDSLALAKCDFGAHNVRMATFMKSFVEFRSVFAVKHGIQQEMKLRFGRFFEDDYPLMLLGPLSKTNMEYFGSSLEVLPHVWIHGLCWRGYSKTHLFDTDNDLTIDDFYDVVMDENTDDC